MHGTASVYTSTCFIVLGKDFQSFHIGECLSKPKDKLHRTFISYISLLEYVLYVVSIDSLAVLCFEVL